jgi:hypothetical protein
MTLGFRLRRLEGLTDVTTEELSALAWDTRERIYTVLLRMLAPQLNIDDLIV